MNEHDYVFGKRIAVRGVTGSGKSTLARALGKTFGLKVIELDAIHWQRPDWQPLPTEEFRPAVEAAIEAAPEGWVCEGNYSAVGDIVLSKIDTLIWINLPWRVSFWRLLKRTLPRAWRNELLWGTQRESLRLTFLSRNSILWWSISHHRISNRRMRARLQEMPQVRAYELRSATEAAALLEAARRQGVS